MSEEIKLTADTKKAIKGFLQEMMNSVTREQAEKDFRKEATAALIKEHSLPQDTVKNLVALHIREEKTRQKADVLNDAVDLYETLWKSSEDNTEE